MKPGDRYYLTLLQEGKPAGIQYFMQRNLRALTFFARSLVKVTEVAEEIVQDSFVKAWESRGKFESAEHLKSFLYVATRNACLNHLNSARAQFGLHAGTLQEELLLTEDNPLKAIILAETIELIHAELEQLPPQQAQVFRLSFFEGLATEDICQHLNLSSNAVFLARSRAKQALRRIFTNEDLLYCFALLLAISGN